MPGGALHGGHCDGQRELCMVFVSKDTVLYCPTAGNRRTSSVMAPTGTPPLQWHSGFMFADMVVTAVRRPGAVSLSY